MQLSLSSPPVDPHRGLSSVRLVLFDVYGTLVDWHSALAAGLMDQLPVERHQAADLARAWRLEAARLLKAQAASGVACRAEALQEKALQTILEATGLKWDSARLTSLVEIWRRFSAWPDVQPGLARLRAADRLVSTLSNGSLAGMVGLCRVNDLRFDALLTSDLLGAFKPSPVMYQRACDLFGVLPSAVLMVASHPYDLRAARSLGLKTAYLQRPLEYGEGHAADLPADDDEFDVVLDRLEPLADRLM